MTADPTSSSGNAFSSNESDRDGLFTLKCALSDYLRDVVTDCALCRQYLTTAWVQASGRDLWLVRRLSGTGDSPASVERAAARLPGWRKSPFWEYDGKRWEAWEERVRQDALGAVKPLLVKRISWYGTPALVCFCRPPEGPELRLLLPDHIRDLPEFPLRRVADGLRCLAHLLSDGKSGSPQPNTPPLPGAVDVKEYLLRAMPKNRYASQLFLAFAE